MVVTWLFHSILLLTFLPHNAPAQPMASLAKRGCSPYCGNVAIPFPFGIGEKLLFQQLVKCDFERPFLASVGLEVLQITLATYGKEQGVGNTSASISLEGSPFVFSQTNNSFAAAGCNTLAFLSGIESTVTGCESVCEEDQNPCGSQDNVKIGSIGPGKDEDGCKYAFLVERQWLVYNMTDPLTWPYMENVPVVLDWGLNTVALDALGLTYYPASDFTSNAYRCGNTSDLSYLKSENSTTQCACYLGYKGNPYLPYGCQGVSIALGLLFLSIYTWKLDRVIKSKKKIKFREKFFKKNGGLLLEQQLYSGERNVEKTTLFKVEELEKATDKFNENRILRQGGQGTVYKGILADGRIVAIKKTKVVDEGQLEQFINEVVILSQINHRNVVKLLGCCLETEVPLLVHEFIPNGTLSQYIHNQSDEFLLMWDMRLQIAIEVAVHGTFGYLDPEYFRSSQITEKSDVYSFGVVLAELLTGQKPICSARSEEDRSLVAYFIAATNENRLFDTIDPRVVDEAKKEEITAVAYLAKRCLNMSGRRRPTMKQVTVELEGIRISRMGSNACSFHEEIDSIETDLIDALEKYTFDSEDFGVDTGVASCFQVEPFTS
ncbi:LOW QUALITY PROTEIN: hypothetical protein BT93_A1765 [Corymbia citriodora subsp. variegata]|nr:LOW QUALITY PROTEIN: hypothetical protein BT93_A1765 [Corymbia citriodora subsp. variegata]